MKKISISQTIFLTLFIVILFSSCSVTKLTTPGKYLITKNSVNITYADSVKRKLKINPSEPLSYIPLSQTPNSRIFGIDFRTWLYLKSNPEKNNWWNRTLRKMGQAPVYYNSVESDKSIENMSIYVAGEGYLDNKITTEVRYKKNRAYVDYNIDADAPYIIDTIYYNFEDSTIADIVKDSPATKLIKKGMVMSRSLLENERTAITNELRNKGYYTFRNNNIDYLVDTLKNDKKAFIKVNINKDRYGNEIVEHKKYKINNIYIFPDIAVGIDANHKFDTIFYKNINYLYSGKPNINPKFLNKQLRLDIGQIWTTTKQEESVKNFLNLKYFKTCNIDYRNISSNDTLDSSYGLLDTYIQLSPLKRHSFNGEVELSSNSNYTSILARIGYTNRNIFRHAEQFNISANVGNDFFYQKGKDNAYQIGLSTSLSFPKLIVPFRVNQKRFINNIQSKIAIDYDLKNRPDYNRHTLSTSFGYSWTNKKRLSFQYNPISLSYIYLPWINESYLESITNPYLKNNYTNQIIAGTTFSILYSDINPVGSTHKFKTGFETAGNTLYLGEKVFNGTLKSNEIEEKYYEIADIRFAQYARIDFDYSYTYNSRSNFAFASRLYAGVGTGYGNSNVMPFERLFYSGGNTSMRGWQIRGLGPGNKPIPEDQLEYPNSLGDIRLELNLEGRFPIWGFIRGAMFFDIGNVWSNGKGESDDRAIFHFNSFYKQLGFNTGLGLRLDLSYFVLRLDWGIILHNPNNPVGERWINEFKLSNTALHFAVGYPF